MGFIVMKSFDNLDDFYENVENGDIVELVFKHEVYYNINSNEIKKEPRNKFCLPINRYIGYYCGFDSRGRVLCMRPTDSTHLNILVHNCTEIVQTYNV